MSSDMIPAADILVVNSPNSTLWPITTNLTRLDLFDNGVNPYFDKKEIWPEVVPPGWSGPLTFTLWIFLKINDKWIGSGIIQFWRGLQFSGGAVYSARQIALNWVYDARWQPMTGHQPLMGEQVGFMVSAGNARNQDNHAVEERSQIVTVPFPSAAQTFLFEPIPIPIPVVNQLDRIEQKIDKILEELNK